MRKRPDWLRICSILIMTILFCGQPPIVGVVQVIAAETANDSWYNDNPEAKTFFLGTAGELAYLGVLVNSGISFQGKTIRLTADIELSGAGNWMPVGQTRADSFKGIFDGAGHAVRNLTADHPEENGVGLFGYINGAVVKNLEIAGGKVTGKSYAGGIAANVEASTIENCGNSAVIAGESQVGGIAGFASGDTGITSCRNAGAVSGETSSGGIVGSMIGEVVNKGGVTDSFNTGEITGAKNSTGGIAGTVSSSIIERSWNLGAVRGKEKAGGIVGNSLTSSAHFSDRSTANGATVINCYNAGTIAGTANVAGIVGGASSHEEAGPTIVSNCYNLPAMDNPIATKAEVSKSYYLSTEDTADSTAGNTAADASMGAVPKSAAAFNSGEVAWLLNMNEESPGSLWGQKDAEFKFNGLEKVPVLADAEHPAVYRIELINREKGDANPGEVVSLEGEYIAQGSKVTLEGRLKDDFMGYVMQIEAINPKNLAINAEREFRMPGSDVKIEYVLIPGALPESRNGKDERPVGREENFNAGDQLKKSFEAGNQPKDSSAGQEKEKSGSSPQISRRLYEVTEEVKESQESTVNLFFTVVIGLIAAAIVFLAALERYITYRKSIC